MPFNALGGDKDQIWQCFTADGQPSKSKLTTRLCHLAPDLFACLQDADFRRQARETLGYAIAPKGSAAPPGQHAKGSRNSRQSLDGTTSL